MMRLWRCFSTHRGRLMSCFLCALTLSLGSCAAKTDSSTFYVKKIELDKDEIGFRLYVTGTPEDRFLDGSSPQAGEAPNPSESDKNAAGQSSSTSDAANGSENDLVLVYGGKTLQDAFQAFFADQTDIYTGTLEAYAFGQALTEEDFFAVALYLIDSPSLPLKVLVRQTQNAS